MDIPGLTTPTAIEAVRDERDQARSVAQAAWMQFDQARQAGIEGDTPEAIAAYQEAQRLGAIYDATAAKLEAVEERLETARRRQEGGAATQRPGRPSSDMEGRWLHGQLHAQAGLSTIDGALGTALAPAENANFYFDLLAPASVMLASGATVLQTSREKLHVPRLTADAVGDWVAEGDELPLSDPEGDAVEIELRKFGAVSTLTKEEAQSSEPAALALAERSLMRKLGLGLDLGFFEGSGLGAQVTGVRNTIGVQISGPTGAFVDLDPLADAVSMLEEADAPRPYAIAMHPSVFRVLRKLKDDTGRGLISENPTVDTPPVLYGAAIYKSTQLDPNLVYAYSPQQIVCVRHVSGAEVAVDPFFGFRAEKIGVRVSDRWSIALPNPEAAVVVEIVDESSS